MVGLRRAKGKDEAAPLLQSPGGQGRTANSRGLASLAGRGAGMSERAEVLKPASVLALPVSLLTDGRDAATPCGVSRWTRPATFSEFAGVFGAGRVRSGAPLTGGLPSHGGPRPAVRGNPIVAANPLLSTVFDVFGYRCFLLCSRGRRRRIPRPGIQHKEPST